MKRAEALKALDTAFETRIDRMFQILADTYSGSPKTLSGAQQHFRDGIGHSIEALAFATDIITEKFKE